MQNIQVQVQPKPNIVMLSPSASKLTWVEEVFGKELGGGFFPGDHGVRDGAPGGLRVVWWR